MNGDESARPRAHPELSEAMLFRSLLDESTEHAVLVSDREGRITYWNCAAERILGYRTEEMRKLRGCDIFTPEDVRLGIPQQERRSAVQEGQAIDERWHMRKDGSRFWASGVTAVLRNDGGDVIGFSKIFRNLTLRKETEDRIRGVNAELSRFAHTAAHDLQEPLRNLALQVQVFERKFKDVAGDEGGGIIAALKENTARMRTLIGDILSYSRITGCRELFQLTDGNAAFDLAVSNLSVAVTESGARVSRGVLPSLTAIPSQLERLLQNLIANAIKFHGEGAPVISVDAQPQAAPEGWQFRVRDNGIGIPPENLDRIFGAFERLHHTEQYPGTGLGLALCKHIVETHGGRIWAESEVGKGSTFHFFLPRHR